MPPSPERIAAVRDEFAAGRDLTLGDTYPEGSTGWVGAARGPEDEDLVLKVGFAHEEARDEALGLRIWSEATAAHRDPTGPDHDADAGRNDTADRNHTSGRVRRMTPLPPPPVPRVLEAFRDNDVSVILMERVVPGFTLAASDLTPEQEDEVVAALLQRLWIPVPAKYAPKPDSADTTGSDAGRSDTTGSDAGRSDATGSDTAEPFRAVGHGIPGIPHDRLRPLAHMCEWWADDAAQRFAKNPSGLPAEVIDGGLDLFRRLPVEYDGEPVLLATDFHHHNVLAATEHPTTAPEDWVAIDPKPYVGDPHYDLVQHMLNFDGRLAEDPVGFAERMAVLTGLDPERAVRWLFARCVQEAPAEDLPGTAQIALTLAPRALG